MSTKRRKVWALFNATEQLPVGVTVSVSDARRERRRGEQVIPFLERLRGDVVLSREEADALRELADRVDRSIPLKYGKSPPDAKCFKCHGTGKYTWEDGHNGDEHESACNCTIPVVLTSGQALARFRGRK